MTVSLEEARKAARLARLALGDDELASLARDLASVVGYIERLQEVDVSAVEPMYHPHEVALASRLDQAEPGVGRAGLQQSAGYEDGLVRVPRVVE